MVYDVASLALLGCFAVAARGIRGRSRRVWLWLLAGQLLNTVADIVFDMQSLVQGDPSFPGWADVLYVVAYPVHLWALLLLVRLREPRRDLAAWLDAAVIAVGLIALVWGFVIGPQLASSQVDAMAVVLSAGYALFDIVLLAVMLRLVLPAGQRGPLLLLVAGSVTWLAADVANSVLALGSFYALPAWTEALWLSGYVLTVAAVLHRKAAQLADVQPADDIGANAGRFVALGIGAFVVPLTLAVAATGGETGSVAIWAWLGLLAMGLVLARLWLLVAALQRHYRRLGEEARTDQLTGLPNRRTWDHEIGRAAAAALTGGAARGVAILDLDRFKDFNDAHGHAAGDALLQDCATAWRAALDPGVMLARYGGEEFAALFPAGPTGREVAQLDDLRRATPAAMTVSIGGTVWTAGEPSRMAFNRADQALYDAKRNGRNRVEWAPSGGRPDDMVAAPRDRRAQQV